MVSRTSSSDVSAPNFSRENQHFGKLDRTLSTSVPISDEDLIRGFLLARGWEEVAGRLPFKDDTAAKSFGTIAAVPPAATPVR